MSIWNEYQTAADMTSSHHKSLAITERLNMAALGLAGEACEFALEVNHTVTRQCLKWDHTAPVDFKDIIKEMGDMLWYVAEAATTLEVKLSDLIEKHLIVGRAGSLLGQPDAWFDWSMRTLTLTGYCGLFSDYIKKVVFHSHELDRAKAIEHLSFAFQQIRQMQHLLGLPIEEILDANIEKLRKRYNGRFTVAASLNRTE